MSDTFANASSQHEAGKRAAEGLRAARTIVAEIIGVDPQEVIFTSGGTESDNLAIKGVALAAPRGRHIVTSAIEHEAVAQSCDYLVRHHGFAITTIGVDHDGFVDIEEVQRALTPSTTLCSIQYANNEVGTVQDIAALAAICKEKNVPFHTDAVQAAGSLPIDKTTAPADLLSFSAHKFGGPKGVGVLVCSSNVFLEPLMHGGGQESGMRSGTSNVPGAVGLAAAFHTAESNRPANTRNMQTLRDELIRGIRNAWPNGILTGSEIRRLPHHASFCFAGTSGESVLLDLETHGIACSSGSACSADSPDTSPVLLAMGFPSELADTAVRFSLGPENTIADIERTIDFFRSNYPNGAQPTNRAD